MDQPRISADGRWYEIEIRHSGLNRFEIVRAKTVYEVQQKAAAKLAQWDEVWNKKVAAEQATEARQSKKELAAKHTEQAQAVIADLGQLLAHTLARDDRIDWETLKDRTTFSKPKPKIPQPVPPKPPIIPPTPSRSDPKYQPRFGLLDYFSSTRKNQKIEEASRLFLQDYHAWEQVRQSLEQKALSDKKGHEAKLAEWKSQVQSVEKQWEAERISFEKQQAERNASIDQLKEEYFRGSPGAIVAYCKLVLSRSRYPETLPKPEYTLDYNPTTKILVVEYVLPSPADMPKIGEVKCIQSRAVLEEVFLSESAINALYDRVLYQIALRTIHELYEADVAKVLDLVVFNGWVNFIDQATGQEVNACILSLQAERGEFLAINLAQVDPKACFKKLKGVGSSKLHGLTPVAPILQLNRDDKRFVSAYAVADQLNEGVNLAAIDWEDFEHLVRELFEKEFRQSGGEVKVTQASRDRGVDAIAFDPDPIRGGKIVIQAKRYTNTVDVAAVRDLYGTVINEGATKGILITTSDYGADAYEFAKGKPLTLLNGGNLLSLLEKHGHKARIDLQEAKRLQADS